MMARLIESEGRWIRALLILSHGHGRARARVARRAVRRLLQRHPAHPGDGVAVRVHPVAARHADRAGRCRASPRNVVVVSVYALLFLVLSAVVLLVAAQLGSSIAGFINDLPVSRAACPRSLAPWQAQLDGLGFEVDLSKGAQRDPDRHRGLRGDVRGPAPADRAREPRRTIGNLLSWSSCRCSSSSTRSGIIAFVNRIMPPRYRRRGAAVPDERSRRRSAASSAARRSRASSMARSPPSGSVVLGIDYAPLTAALVAIFQMIPFFGPFVSWAPPVVAALLTQARRGRCPILDHHGRRLVHRHEHRPAARHGERRRHPPGGRARVRADRAQAHGRRRARSSRCRSPRSSRRSSSTT